MSRSGYSDDCDGWALIRWRGAVNAAVKGRRGQAFLREMLQVLDGMTQRRLIAEDLERDGEVCAMGAVGRARCLDQSNIDPYNREQVAEAFGIAPALAAEIAFENDSGSYWRHDAPEERWMRVRAWVASQITESQ